MVFYDFELSFFEIDLKWVNMCMFLEMQLYQNLNIRFCAENVLKYL